MMDFAEAVHMKGFGWADYEIARDAMAVVILKSQRPGSRGIFRVLSKGAKNPQRIASAGSNCALIQIGSRGRQA